MAEGKDWKVTGEPVELRLTEAAGVEDNTMCRVCVCVCVCVHHGEKEGERGRKIQGDTGGGEGVTG